MTARATSRINSGYGTFLPGDPIVGVPEDAITAWVAAGIAVRVEARPSPPDETATAPVAETAAARPRRTKGRKVSGPPAEPAPPAEGGETGAAEGEQSPAAEE